MERTAKEKTKRRLSELLQLQKEIEQCFGAEDYNIFVFGSYLTTAYQEGESDIDIAIYTKNFTLYKQISMYLENYFMQKNITSDIFYIDLTMEAPIYCAPLQSKVQFTDYFPQELIEFHRRCQGKLQETRARLAV